MAATAPSDSKRRWLILALIGLAQLMVVLDVTIVNIALPSAQKALGFSNDARQWIVTAYALSFGSLLLLGGRLGDLIGRKRVFVAGLAGFAGASAVGGLAQSFGVLVVARAVQGGFAALLAPAALSRSAATPARKDASGAKRRSWVWAATRARSSSSAATAASSVGGAMVAPRWPAAALNRLPRSSKNGFTRPQ